MSEDIYKERMRDYLHMMGNDVKVLKDLRDRYLDSVRIINEVIAEVNMLD